MHPVHSIEWMLASIRNAGLSRCSPVSLFVTVTSQMSRPSNDVPMDSSAAELRRFLRPRAQRVGELFVRVEVVVRDGAHVLTG